MTENEMINGWTFEETIKVTENLMEAESNMFKWDVLRHLRDFVESFKDELKQYRAIGTVEEFKALKEKNEPKKQGNINDYDSHLKLSKAGFLCCSTTNKDIRYPLISLRDLEYCPKCGQRLDWNGDEEYDD